MRISDWSSDVCSSDLRRHHHARFEVERLGSCRAPFHAHRAREIGALGERADQIIDPRVLRDLIGELQRTRRLQRGQQPDAAGGHAVAILRLGNDRRSEEHTSELQSLMRISYAVFCLKKKKKSETNTVIQRTYLT